VGGLEGKKLKFLRTFVAASVYAACGSVYAQNLATLEPVVVSASKVSEPQGQATVLVEVINRQQIESSGAVNVTELLDQVSGGLLTRQYGRLGVDAAFDLGYLGGASAQRTLVLIDGARTNDIDDSTVHWSQLPIDAIEQVEIRKAGGGVLFGDRALGGVVNIITKREQDSGNAHVTVGSFGTRVLGVHKNSRVNNIHFGLSAQQAETDGYRAMSAQDIRSIKIDASRRTSSGEIGINLRSFTEEILQPSSISLEAFQKNPRAVPDETTETSRRGSNTDLWITRKIDELTGVRARISYGQVRSTYNFSNLFYEDSRTHNDRYSGDFFVARDLTVGKVLAGLDFFDAESESTRTKRFSVYQRSRALYLNSEIPVRESLVNLGVRHQRIANTFYQTRGTNPQTSDEDIVSWSVGGLTPIAGGTLRLSVQSSFSFPTADQLYTFGGNDFAPKDIYPGIRAMSSNETQFAFTRKLDLYRIEWGGRYIEIRDEIGFKPDCVGSDACNTNLYDTSRMIGFVKVSGSVSPEFSWSISADRIQSEIESGRNAGKRVPMVPNFVAKTSFSWARDGHHLRLIANHRGHMAQSGDDSNTGFRIPSRLTLDLGYSRSWRNESTELAIWLRNLADSQYFDFSAYGFVSPADGRSIDLRFKQSF
jgi:iron complex outermembrane receptor protein